MMKVGNIQLDDWIDLSYDHGAFDWYSRHITERHIDYNVTHYVVSVYRAPGHFVWAVEFIQELQFLQQIWIDTYRPSFDRYSNPVVDNFSLKNSKNIVDEFLEKMSRLTSFI